MNKARNLIAILAIALTSVLFTSVAATSFSYVKSTQQAECRMTMDSSHMTVQDATKEEYDQVVQAVSADKSVVRYGVGRFLGSAANQEKRSSLSQRMQGWNTPMNLLCVDIGREIPLPCHSWYGCQRNIQIK